MCFQGRRRAGDGGPSGTEMKHRSSLQLDDEE